MKARIAFDRAQMELIPRFNIAPTQPAPVIVLKDGQLVLQPMRWGLIPFWAKDASIGDRMINARAETVKEKPAYRTSFKRRRCLVVADSFYEWQKLPDSKLKQPMRILLQDEQPFAFAGLWDTWTGPDGSEVETFTIVTGEPNTLVAAIHHRMAVILPPERYPQWLDPQFQDTDQLTGLLTPFPPGQMKMHRVSTRVNNPKFEDARCIEALAQENAPSAAAMELPMSLGSPATEQ